MKVPHVHGTGIAGAIRIPCAIDGWRWPAARILAIRAFVVASASVQSNSFAILKGLDMPPRTARRSST